MRSSVFFWGVAMKLFVWNHFCPDWSDGLAFAIAETVDEAKQMIIEDTDTDFIEWGVCRELPIDGKVSYYVYGAS